jgi:diguanylate cyclase (GGDEF)-like protein
LEYTFIAMGDEALPGEGQGSATPEVRASLTRGLLDRTDVIIADAVAVFPFSGPRPLDTEYCQRIGLLLLQLLAAAVRDGHLDSRAGFVSDLRRLAAERSLPAEQLFEFLYLIERTTLDELALSDSLGATSEPWALAAQLVRRASFHVLAACTDRCQQEPATAVLTDRLTTLYTRAVMKVIVAAELQRSDRFSFPLAFIVFDVDHLTEINSAYGYGVGDRLLERLGILMRNFFRQNDWVFRHGDDSIAVLLCQIGTEDTAVLAGRVLGMVKERLGFKDYRTERRVEVSVSAAVVTMQGSPGDSCGTERLLIEADAALERAKLRGRNRLESAVVNPSSLPVDATAHYLQCSQADVRALIANGSLRALGSGEETLVDWSSAESYRRTKDSSQPAQAPA